VTTPKLPANGGGKRAFLPPRRPAIRRCLPNEVARKVVERLSNIGLSLGIIPSDVFTMLVIMAAGTTIMTGPLLQLLLSRAGSRVTSLAEA